MDAVRRRLWEFPAVARAEGDSRSPGRLIGTIGLISPP
jgi:hypothetical protein